MERFKFVGPARLPINATFLTNMWPEYFSFNICTVVHQSELDLSNLDQNWAPTRPTLRRSECVHSFEFFLSDGLPKRIEQLMLLLNPISEKKNYLNPHQVIMCQQLPSRQAHRNMTGVVVVLWWKSVIVMETAAKLRQTGEAWIILIGGIEWLVKLTYIQTQQFLAAVRRR